MRKFKVKRLSLEDTQNYHYQKRKEEYEYDFNSYQKRAWH